MEWNELSLRKTQQMLQNPSVRMSNAQLVTPSPGLLPPFFEDVHFLLLPNNQELVQKASGWLGAYIGAASDAAQTKLETDLAASAASDRSTMRRILQMLAFLSRGLPAGMIVDPAQTAISIAEVVQNTAGGNTDLQLSSDEFDRLQTLIAGLAERAGELNQAVDTRSIIRGILPMFEDLKATVELRSVQWPLDPNAADNQPFELIPLASLSLQLDSGDPPVMCFQATEEDLAALLDKLQRLQTALVNLKKVAVTLKPNV